MHEGYSQLEIDNLFKAIVLPNLVHGLSVFGASKAELSTMQRVLNRCFKGIIFLIMLNSNCCCKTEYVFLFYEIKTYNW